MISLFDTHAADAEARVEISSSSSERAVETCVVHLRTWSAPEPSVIPRTSTADWRTAEALLSRATGTGAFFRSALMLKMLWTVRSASVALAWEERKDSLHASSSSVAVLSWVWSWVLN